MLITGDAYHWGSTHTPTTFLRKLDTDKNGCPGRKEANDVDQRSGRRGHRWLWYPWQEVRRETAVIWSKLGHTHHRVAKHAVLINPTTHLGPQS